MHLSVSRLTRVVVAYAVMGLGCGSELGPGAEHDPIDAADVLSDGSDGMDVAEVADADTDATRPDVIGPDAERDGDATTADGDGTTPDATMPDTTTPDGTTPDGTTPDATTPDGTTPDGTTSDATTPDGTTPDATTPDGTTSDATTPDGTTPDATTPDGTTPDATNDVSLPDVDLDTNVDTDAPTPDAATDDGSPLADAADDTHEGPAEDGYADSDASDTGDPHTPTSMVCEPCDDDATCQEAGDRGARCVQHTTSATCGTSCDAACDDGYTCAEVTTTAGEVTRQCVPEHGGPCGCDDFTAEHCNGRDDDCDQAVDEGCACAAGETRTCGLGVGACVLGVQRCEAAVWGACDAVGATVEACDAIDNDCDGATDEGLDHDYDGASGCGVDCDDDDPTLHPGATELSDDGIDSNCDQRELFDGQALALDGRLDATTLRTTTHGTFDVAGIGPIDVTGTVTRPASGAPATWCLEGPLTATLGALRFTHATIEVCQPGTTEIDGTATIYGHTVTVAGTYDRVTHDLHLDVTGRVRIAGDTLDWDIATGTITIVDGTLTTDIHARRAAWTLGAYTATQAELVVAATPSVAADLTLDGLTLRASGDYTPTTAALSLALTTSSPWRPVADVVLNAVTGTLTRTAGVVHVELGGAAQLVIGDAQVTAPLRGTFDDGVALSGTATGPFTLAAGLATTPSIAIAIADGSVTAEAVVTAPLPSGWPTTRASLRGTVQGGRATLTGSIDAPYRLGPDFTLANAYLTLVAAPGASTLTLGGAARLPWDPTGPALDFRADIHPGERPLLLANAVARDVCGFSLGMLEVSASVSPSGVLTLGESLDGNATLTIEGVPHALAFEGAAEGADFSLSANVGDVTLMHGAVRLRNAVVEVVCEGGVATRTIRGSYELLQPDGTQTPVTLSGTLGADGIVPSLRARLGAQTSVEVFAGKATLTNVLVDVVRTNDGATFFLEGEERVTIDALQTDLALRYRGAFAPGVEPLVLDGVPLSDDGGLQLGPIALATVTGRLSTSAQGTMVRDIAGRYDYELPDGDFMSAKITGHLNGSGDTVLRGEIVGDAAGDIDDGTFMFLEDLWLDRAGLEVVLSATEKRVAIYGDFEFQLGDRVFMIGVRGQFSNYSASAEFKGQQITLSGRLSGENGGPLVEVVPGFLDLSDVTVSVVAQKLKNNSEGNKLALRLEGRALVAFDDTPNTVVVSGELGLAQSSLVTPGSGPTGKKRPVGLMGRLEGRIIGDIQPLRSVLGDDRAALIDPLVSFDFRLKPTPTVRLIVAADAEVCVTETCVLGTGIELAAVGVFEYARGGDVSGWVRGAIRNITLPGVGSLGSVGFVINTDTLVDFDILADNSELTSDSRFWIPAEIAGDNRFNRLPSIDPGVTFVYQATLPVIFPGLAPQEVQFAFGIGPTSAQATAKVPLNVPLIVPEFHFPGIDRVTLIDGRVTINVGFESQAVFLSLDGRAELLPADQTLPLVGTVNLRGGMDPAGYSIDGMATVSGRWRDPMGLQGFAFQNPSIAFGVAITNAGNVYPSSIGANGDLFLLLKDAWPPETTDLTAAPPGNVLKLGGTLYFDRERTRSALCLPLNVYCPALPTLIARFELKNLNMKDLYLWMQRMSDFVVSVGSDIAEAFTGTVFSHQFIPDLDPDEGNIVLDDASFTFSTHDVKVLGQRWEGGLRAGFHIDYFGNRIDFDGYAWSDAIRVDGFADGLDLFYLNMVGDPYWQTAQPATGHLEAPADTRLDLPAGTIEARVRGTWSATPATPATILDRTTIDGGYRVRVGDPDDSGSARVIFEARRGIYTRTTTTEDGEVPDDGELHHVAVVFSGGEAEIFIDGFKAEAMTTGADAASLAAGPGPGGVMNMGMGMTEIDDIRVWSTLRPRADLRAQRTALPLGFQRDPALIVRYEFDYDTAWSPVHNSRLYGSDMLHAAYVGGAKPFREIEHNDLHLVMHISLSEFSLGLQAGASLWFPPLAPLVPDGIDYRARFFLDIEPASLRAKGNFQLTPTAFMPAFYFDDQARIGIDGLYIAEGGGPNLVRGDFDDGPYGAFDGEDLSLAASVAIVHMSLVDFERTEIGSGSISFHCPPGQTCSKVEGKELRAEADVDLVIPLGTGPILDLPPEQRVDVEGHLSTSPGELSIGGSAADPGRITALGYVIADGCFFATSDTRLTVCDDCGNGAIEGAELCDDGNTDDGDGCSALCKTEPLDSTPGVKRVGWRGVFDIPQLVHANLNANIPLGGEFLVTGDGWLKAGTFALSETSFRLDPSGFTGRHYLRIGESQVLLQGRIEADGRFDLGFDGNLTIAGMTLADAHVKAYWNGTVGGVDVRGFVDLGFTRVEVTGVIDSSGKVRLVYDGALDIGGWAMSNSHLEVTEDGAQLSGDLHFGAASAYVTGAFGADGVFSLAGAYDLPLGGFSSEATMTLSGDADGVRGALNANLTIGESSANVSGVITPGGGYRLSGDGTLRFSGRTWAGLAVSLNDAAPDAGFRANGQLDLGFTTLTAGGSVAPDGTFRFEADQALSLGSLTTTGHFVVSNAGVSLAANVAIDTSSVAVAGDVAANGDFTLTGSADLVIAGHTLAAAAVSATRTAVSVTAGYDLPSLGRAALRGDVADGGQLALDAAIDNPSLGFVGTVHLDNDGMDLSGKLGVLGNQVTLSGSAAAGAWQMSGTTNLTLGGFAAANTKVFFASTGVVSLEANVAVLGSTVTLRGNVNGDQFSLTGTSALTLAGYPLANATITLSSNGMSLAGELQVLGSGIAMSGSVTPGGAFALSSAATLSLFGRTLTSASATLTNAGLSLSGHLDFTVEGIRLVADASLSDGKLRGSGSVTTFGTTVAVTDLALDGQGMTFKGLLDLPVALLTIRTEVAFAVSFVTPSVCGSGVAVVDTDLGDYPCDVDVCIGALGAQPSRVECHGRCWSDAPCGDGKFCDGLGNCWPKRPLGDTCPGLLLGDHECASGFCDPWAVVGKAVCAPRLGEGIGCLQDGQCQSNACGARPGMLEFRCFDPGTRGIDQECYDPAHCHSGECWGLPTYPSRCLCLNNDDCTRSGFAGQVCNIGSWGVEIGSGFCMAPRGPGQQCDATSECGSGLVCSESICVQPATRHNFETCSADAECIAGECWGGVCRCVSDGECAADRGSNYYCDQGAWLVGNNEGRCHPKLSHEDAPYCESDSWCQSGKCTYSGRLARNICYVDIPQPGGSVCNIHQHCASGYCDPNRGYTCRAEPHTIHNWGTCEADIDCMTGKCYGGVCRCEDVSDCTTEYGAGHYCDEGVWLLGNNEGRCHAALPDSGAPYCESDAWCQSGRCDWSPRQGRNICWSPVAQPGGATCDLDGHCASNSCNENRNHTCDPAAYTVANNVRNYCEDVAWCEGGWPGGWGHCQYSLAASKTVCVAPAQRVWGDPCDVDMQCGGDAGLRCLYWPIGGGGVGRPDIVIGYYCGY